VGLIGLFWKKQDALPLRYVVVFEIILVVASFLSYGEKVIWYFVAYNIGGLLFGLFMKKDLSFKVFDNFGSLGFTFFLGAEIPTLMLRTFGINLYEINPYFHFIISFCLTLLLSYIVTRWIENPLLAWGKKIENKKLK
jgi:peptidoglycan/LPS O-acetylase OafA/YrhL